MSLATELLDAFGFWCWSIWFAWGALPEKDTAVNFGRKEVRQVGVARSCRRRAPCRDASCDLPQSVMIPNTAPGASALYLGALTSALTWFFGALVKLDQTGARRLEGVSHIQTESFREPLT